jgi:hypothetical protein
VGMRKPAWGSVWAEELVRVSEGEPVGRWALLLAQAPAWALILVRVPVCTKARERMQAPVWLLA